MIESHAVMGQRLAHGAHGQPMTKMRSVKPGDLAGVRRRPVRGAVVTNQGRSLVISPQRQLRQSRHLFLSDFFDFSGTAIGVGKQAGYVDKDGNIPQFKKALIVDGLAAIAGGAASSSSATTYIESGSGVAAGGRTGWVAVVAGLLFFPFMFISPLIGMVPAQATAAALIVVGWLMISTLTEMEGEAEGGTASKLAGIDFHDLAIGLSAALTIVVMPFTYSITNGIGFGFITYTLVRGGERARRAAQVCCAAELAGVLIVGTWTLVDKSAFPDATVWSDYGMGYVFIPVLLPISAL